MLKFRSSLSFYRLFSIGSLRPASCSIIEDGKKLKLHCDGEVERRYHGVWLRHNCRCPECLPPAFQQNIVHHSHLVDLKIIDATVKDNDVQVIWQSKTGPHSCTFDIHWLKEYDYTTPKVQQERIQSQLPVVATSLPKSDYNQVMSSKEGYYEWMKQVNYYGMSLLQNVPTRDMEMVRICESIGMPQVHAYKTVFDVIATEDASDVAYTTDELLPHSDQNFFESAPGVQILFCIKFDECVEGGESVIIDTYPVVEELRNKYPEYFKVLTRVPCITQRVHDSLDKMDTSVNFKYSYPHLSLDHNGQINSISWSPQFRHPLLASEQDTEDYYEAFVQLSSMLDESPLKFQHRLRPGEALVLNNRRVLHSRNSFKLNGGERYLQGHYLNTDFFRSRFRVLMKQLKKSEPVKKMFNRSYVA